MLAPNFDKTKKKIKYFVREYRDRPATKREIIALLDAEITDDYIAQSVLIEKRILTLAKIRQYQKNGTLNPIFHRGKRMMYFLKSKVQMVLEDVAKKKKENPQGRLF